MPGGFVGVDVFFVLSGYLVTEVLLRDLHGPGGRIAFGRFYARRVRRLLPAAVVTLVVTAAVYGAVASPLNLLDAIDSFRASLLYVANWHFIADATDYFSTDVDDSPVLHFWSLAVEEQFYLAWPLLLAGLWALAGRRWGGEQARRRVAAAVAVGAVASYTLAMSMRVSASSRAYFGTDTRAYQLLAGAFLALLPGLVGAVRARRGSRLLAPLGLVGVFAASSSLLDQGPFVRSTLVTVAAAALIVGIDAHDRAPVARAFSLRPIVYLGTISYATYLWHWPVIVVARELEVAPSPVMLALLTTLLATGIAALSSELLELPIRRSGWLDRHRRTVIAAGLAMSVFAALVVVPPLVDLDRVDHRAPRSATPAVASTPVPDDFSYRDTRIERFGRSTSCDEGPVGDCTLVDGDGPHLFLMGDSNAVMYTPAFAELARQQGLRFSTGALEGCPWQLDVYQLADYIQERCRQVRPDTYDRVIPELAPDIVVVVNARLYAGRGEFADDAESRDLRERTDASLDRLVDSGAHVVVVAPAPHAPTGDDPLLCLAEVQHVEECRFTALQPDDWIQEHLRDRAATSESITYVDWSLLICPLHPTCEAMIDGVPVFWNENHIATRYAESMAGPLARELAALGLIPPVDASSGGG